MKLRALLIMSIGSLLVPTIIQAQKKATVKEKVYRDKNGIIRWTHTKQEVALFGANYALPSACDYRAAGYVTNDRKKVVDQDMAHFARMGWDGMRLCLWGDYENTDYDGNLLNNDHLNLLDYVIFKAKERGIYFLLSPIVTYSSQWPDAMQDTVNAKGFSTHFKKSELGTDSKAIEAQQNYLRQLLNHVNPYTGVALKDEPNILFIEMINEPWHHSNDVAGSVKYINALVDAVRSTGCKKLVFHNLSQDFNMAAPMQQSKIEGATFAWYPSGLNSGGTLSGNYLPVVDDYSLMLKPELKQLSRIVYEFDSPDLLTGFMYPAMARTFRSVGAQFAAMFSYDMLATAPYNLGWQTHYLNMVYTPVKAISAIIAGEVMKNIPMYTKYAKYPANTLFGPFHVDYTNNLGEMVTDEKFMYTNNTVTNPSSISSLRKIVGYGSSPVVAYEGKGIYFLDKIKDGVWRLEVYPDALQVDDPFKMPSPGKVVTRTISRAWAMTINIPSLTKSFVVESLNQGNTYSTIARDGQIIIKPGVYILKADKNFSNNELPAKIGQVNMNEFECLADQSLPLQVIADYNQEYLTDKPVIISANVYSQKDPESVTLYYKTGNSNRFFPVRMQKDKGYTYKAVVPAHRIPEGWINFCIVVKDDTQAINFPSGIDKSPADWDYYGSATWTSKIVKSNSTPLRLLYAADDAGQLSFTRIGDGIRTGIYKMIPASNTGEAAFHLELPLSYDKTLDDYTLSVPVTSKIKARDDIATAQSLLLNVRGENQKQDAYITLVENDGTSWSSRIELSKDWKTVKIPLDQLKSSRGVMLPLGYPGRWDYWFTAADGRGGASDHIHMDKVDWIQLSVRQSNMKQEDAKDNSWIDITSAIISFEK